MWRGSARAREIAKKQLASTINRLRDGVATKASQERVVALALLYRVIEQLEELDS